MAPWRFTPPTKKFYLLGSARYRGESYYNAPVIHAGQVCEEPAYITNAFTDNALRFLEQQKTSDSPFYLSVHYTAPLSLWDRDQHPQEIYDEYFNHCAFDSIPREPMHPWQIDSALHGYTEDSRRPILSGYFSAVTAMDKNIGRILEWLEQNGLRQNTLVIFSGDNGMNIGHHGIFGKGNGTFPVNMYDTSVKVPMIISQPGSIPHGIVDTHLLSHYDLFPTLLDYVGLDNPRADDLPGRSFAPLLRGLNFNAVEAMIIFDEYGPTRMIRSREWKYIHRYPYGPHELYDLVHDLGERANLIAEDGYQDQVKALKASLDAWFVRYVDPRFDGAHEPVTGKGQLGLAGPAGLGEAVFANDWHYLK